MQKTLGNNEAVDDEEDYQILTMPSQLANPNLSIGSELSFSDDANPDDNNAANPVESNQNTSSDHEILSESSDQDTNDSVNEIVIQVGGEENEVDTEKGIYRQPSTTEYLSGMIHTLTPSGLLPQYPSWSLVCVGHSSIYSHNSGLSTQSGFLTGSNCLLPWDVQVRLENAASWARSLGKTRHRRKPQPIVKEGGDDQVFMLKIFVGCEYECPRGHRFFMSSPSEILHGALGELH